MLVEAPSAGAPGRRCSPASTRSLPSPGVPDRHPVFAAARPAGVPGARRVRPGRARGTTGRSSPSPAPTARPPSPRWSPRCSPHRAGERWPCGNTEIPLVEAIDDPDTEVFVVEASSFRLGHTRRFRPDVATWLNFAPDHLDVHDSLAPTRRPRPGSGPTSAEGEGLAVANADDPVVLANRNADVDTVTFGVDRAGADCHRRRRPSCACPTATRLVDVDELPASAAPRRGQRARRRRPRPSPPAPTLDGVRYGAAQLRRPAAPGGAGGRGRRRALVRRLQGHHAPRHPGRRRGLRVGGAHRRRPQQGPRPLARSPTPRRHVRAVVAIGEAADEVAAAFDGRCPVRAVTTDMDDVVAAGRPPGPARRRRAALAGVRLVRLVRLLRRAGRRLRRRGATLWPAPGGRS